MKIIPTLIATGALALTGAALAQQVERQLRPGVIVKPQLSAVKRPEMRTVRVQSIPASALRIMTWPGVQVARVAPAPPGGISTAGASAYVAKRWFTKPSPRNQACNEPVLRSADEIDLTEPRRHGFRLAALKITELDRPQDYAKPQYPMRRSPNLDADGNWVAPMEDVVKIPLSALRYNRYASPAMPVFCFTGYRVDLTLRGPADIDPFTGRKIVRQQVN